MAVTQIKLNLCSIAVSKIIGDEVTSSSADGNLFTGLDRLEAINRARGNVYSKILNTTGISQFLAMYPEFSGTKTVTAPTLNTIPDKGADCRAIIKLYLKSMIAEGIPAEQKLNALYDNFSNWRATSTSPKFIEETQSVVILGVSLSAEDNIIMSYLKQPVDISGYSPTGEDLIEPYTWLGLIINEAVAYLYYTKQKMIPQTK